MSMTPQWATHWSPRNCRMSMAWMSTGLPLADTPMNSPVWVPTNETRATTLSPPDVLGVHDRLAQPGQLRTGRRRRGVLLGAELLQSLGGGTPAILRDAAGGEPREVEAGGDEAEDELGWRHRRRRGHVRQRVPDGPVAAQRASCPLDIRQVVKIVRQCATLGGNG